jgi:hypothetical protein
MRYLATLVLLAGCSVGSGLDRISNGEAIDSASIPRTACSYELNIDGDTLRGDTSCFAVDEGQGAVVAVKPTEGATSVHVRFGEEGSLRSADLFGVGWSRNASGSAVLSVLRGWSVKVNLTTADGHSARGEAWSVEPLVRLGH